MVGIGSLILLSQAHASQSFDIGGIRLGSSAVEAQSAASAMNSKLTFSELKRREDGKVMGVSGTEAGAFPKDSVKIFFDEQNATWFVHRSQRYAEGSRPSREGVFVALKEKFGEPTFSNTTDLLSGNASWHFDRSGKIYKGPLGKAPCSGTDSMGRGTPPSTFPEHCGTFIQATWNFANKEKMVDELGVTIHESSRMYDTLKRVQDKSNSAKREALEAERSKSVKPKI